MNSKVSVIIPVYNAGDYLTQCLDSVINQTLQEIEIIIINDGSLDKSGDIINNYALKDERIFVLNQENQGLSIARNRGFLLAKGDYIAFLDSDDYINEDGLEQLYTIASENNLDVVAAGRRLRKNKKPYDMENRKLTFNQLMTGEQFMTERLLDKDFSTSVTRKIYKREFLKTHNILFTPGLIHEDLRYNVEVLLKAKRVIATKIIFYYFNSNENSLTRRKDRTFNGECIIKACYEIETLICRLENELLKKLLNDYIAMIFLYGIDFGNLYDNRYNGLYDKKFLTHKAYFIESKMKVLLFLISKNLYRWVKRRR